MVITVYYDPTETNKSDLESFEKGELGAILV